MVRRDLLVGATAATSLLLGCRGLVGPGGLAPNPPNEDLLTHASVAELAALIASGAITAVSLAQHFLGRIERLDKHGPAVNAIIELNPDALNIASQRDAETRSGKRRGLLHGIPILIKDNIDSADRMCTSAGSLALASGLARQDAFLVAQLRRAGAVLLGKTNLSEWANFRSTRATSGWSARGGLTKNPHALDRNPSGSSSGTAAAIAAGFAPLGIGTETDGSIVSPAAVCGIVGVKPTVGLVSRSGLIPVANSQDTAGPMARTVSDAALLLSTLNVADSNDQASQIVGRRATRDYTEFLQRDALVGARIGVMRTPTRPHPEAERALKDAIDALRGNGATVVDDIEIGSSRALEAAELDVLLYEFKDGLSRYLATRGATVPVHSLAELIAFNQREHAREMSWFQQEIFELAQQKGPLSDPDYRTARLRCLQLARTDGLDALFGRYQVEALICSSNAPAWVTDLVSGDHIVSGGNSIYAAVAGYPSITVPMGRTSGLPLGLSFVGPAWSEPRLISLAYAFEQHTLAYRPPRFLPTVGA